MHSDFATLSRRSALLPLLAAALRPSARPAAAALPTAPEKGFLTGSGLRYFDFGEGAGEPPRYGQLIRFNYVAYVADGSRLKQFDSSYDREPYLTKHGNGFTAQGIEEALHTMRPGGRRPELAAAPKRGMWGAARPCARSRAVG